MKELYKLINDLNKHETLQVVKLIEALQTELDEEYYNYSEYFNDEAKKSFRASLLSQHLFLNNPLFQDTFENAFISAMNAGGFNCKKAPDGERFWDLDINGRKISLKSTKAKNLSKDKLKISKLTEAAWIQDCRTASMREEKTKHLFLEYQKKIHSIIQLRYFIKDNYYELIEIPIILFAEIQNVPRNYFNADGPTIDIPVGANPPFLKVKLDRSDSKITINSILKSHCNIIGIWRF